MSQGQNQWRAMADALTVASSTVCVPLGRHASVGPGEGAWYCRLKVSPTSVGAAKCRNWRQHTSCVTIT